MDKSELIKRAFHARRIKELKRFDEGKIFKKKFVFKDRLLKSLILQKVDMKFIAAICLLTDGSLSIEGNHYRIAYYTKDDVLKSFYYNMLVYLSNYIPSINEDKKHVFGVRVSDALLGKKLILLSPSYKKMPSKNQKAQDYLREIQPSLRFIENANENTRKWCIRFAFSTDGCISIPKKMNFELTLACYNSNLCKEWIEILKEYNITAHLGREKTSWSGVDGIRVFDKGSLMEFVNLGGFVPGVKVTNKSKYFKGIEKNKVLGILIKKKGPVA